MKHYMRHDVYESYRVSGFNCSREAVRVVLAIFAFVNKTDCLNRYRSRIIGGGFLSDVADFIF